MANREKIQAEVDANFEAFQKLMPSISNSQSGKYALLRHKKIVEFFDSAGDARLYAQAQFEDGLWSIQHVTNQVADLGYFSHAVHNISIQSDRRASD